MTSTCFDLNGIDRTERWDSLAYMQLILALEDALGHTLDTDAVLAIESLTDVETLLS